MSTDELGNTAMVRGGGGGGGTTKPATTLFYIQEASGQIYKDDVNGFPPLIFASCSFVYSCGSENGYPLAHIV